MDDPADQTINQSTMSPVVAGDQQRDAGVSLQARIDEVYSMMERFANADEKIESQVKFLESKVQDLEEKNEIHLQSIGSYIKQYQTILEKLKVENGLLAKMAELLREQSELLVEKNKQLVVRIDLYTQIMQGPEGFDWVQALENEQLREDIGLQDQLIQQSRLSNWLQEKKVGHLIERLELQDTLVESIEQKLKALDRMIPPV